MTVSDTILQGIRQAIVAEDEGHWFYRMAANATSDPRGREVFEALAAEELAHMAFLKAQLASLKQTGKVDPRATLGAPRRLEGKNPIFTDALVARIKDAHYEMTSLSVAVQLELQAEQFYRAQAAAAAADAEVKSFFTTLADWEKGHHDALLAQQETLKAAYWNENRFYPF